MQYNALIYQKKFKQVSIFKKLVKLSLILLGSTISLSFLTRYSLPSYERAEHLMMFQLLFMIMALGSYIFYYVNLRDLHEIESTPLTSDQDQNPHFAFKKKSYLFHSACYLTTAMIFQWLDHSSNINIFNTISDIFGSLFVVCFGYFLWYSYKTRK